MHKYRTSFYYKYNMKHQQLNRNRALKRTKTILMPNINHYTYIFIQTIFINSSTRINDKMISICLIDILMLYHFHSQEYPKIAENIFIKGHRYMYDKIYIK